MLVFLACPVLSRSEERRIAPIVQLNTPRSPLLRTVCSCLLPDNHRDYRLCSHPVVPLFNLLHGLPMHRRCNRPAARLASHPSNLHRIQRFNRQLSLRGSRPRSRQDDLPRCPHCSLVACLRPNLQNNHFPGRLRNQVDNLLGSPRPYQLNSLQVNQAPSHLCNQRKSRLLYHPCNHRAILAGNQLPFPLVNLPLSRPPNQLNNHRRSRQARLP